MIREGLINGRKDGKAIVIDDSGRRFTKSARALHATRSAADAAMQRLLRRKA